MDSILLMFVIAITGACLLGIAVWGRDLITKTTGKTLKWWHWLLYGLWAIIWLVAFAWLGSQLGETPDVDKAAWLGFGVLIAFNIILGLVTWQLIVRQKPAEG